MHVLLSIVVSLSVLSAFAVSNAVGDVYHDAHRSLVFDAAGNLAVAANDLAVSRFTYDDHRVEAAETLIGKAVFATVWRRDADGLVTNLVYAPGKAVTKSYDTDGRLAQVRDWLGHEWTFTHDGAGRPTGDKSPDGTTHAFSYDAAGRLVGTDPDVPIERS